MRETTDEFAARGMRLWREHIQAGIRRMQENGAVWQSAEYTCYDQPVPTRICETCKGTGYMVIDMKPTQFGDKIMSRVECPFGCEGGKDD